VFFAAFVNFVVQFNNSVDHLVQPNNVGKVGDILCEVVLDDLQQHLLILDGYLRIDKCPQKLAVILRQQIRICDCLLYMQQCLYRLLVKLLLQIGHLFDQLNHHMRIVLEVGLRLAARRFIQKQHKQQQQFVKDGVDCRPGRVLENMKKRQHSLKTHLLVAVENEVRAEAQFVALLQPALPLLEDESLGILEQVDGVFVLVELLSKIILHKEGEQADRGSLAVYLVKEHNLHFLFG
jgi:hypothetical protein